MNKLTFAGLSEQMSDDIIKLSKTSSSIQFTNEKLIKMNEKINEIAEEIYFATNMYKFQKCLLLFHEEC